MFDNRILFTNAVDTCKNGLRQSPIDLTGCTRVQMKALRLKGHNDYRSETFTMLNTGYTGEIIFFVCASEVFLFKFYISVQITFGGQAPTLFGGPLSGEYTFLHMYFVWGSEDGHGSAHAVNGYL